MAFDSIFKSFIEGIVDEAVLFTNVAVGKLPLKIDVVIRGQKKPIFKERIPILEERFADINIIEYKSSHDMPKKEDLTKIIGYVGLYASNNQMGIVDIIKTFTMWYITVKRAAFLTRLEELNLVESNAGGVAGLYKMQFKAYCASYILVINELSISQENAALLVLSSGETLRAFLEHVKNKKITLSSTLKNYLSLRYYVDHAEVHIMEEYEELFSPVVKNNIRMAVEKIGIKRVVDAVGLKKVVDAVGLKKVIDEFGPERVINTLGLKNIIKLTEPEELKKVLQELGFLEKT
ncbi:MAG: hypothetical protein ACTSWN_10810 [Promethearchaeota archaeon]